MNPFLSFGLEMGKSQFSQYPIFLILEKYLDSFAWKKKTKKGEKKNTKNPIPSLDLLQLKENVGTFVENVVEMDQVQLYFVKKVEEKKIQESGEKKIQEIGENVCPCSNGALLILSMMALCFDELCFDTFVGEYCETFVEIIVERHFETFVEGYFERFVVRKKTLKDLEIFWHFHIYTMRFAVVAFVSFLQEIECVAVEYDNTSKVVETNEVAR